MTKRYTLGEMIPRLLKKAAPIRSYLVVSTFGSVVGNLSRMGLMGFGSMWILCAFGMADGNEVIYAVLTVLSGLMIAICRYLEGVYSHRGAYGLLASMRVDLYEKIDRISPAYLIDHQMGDIMNTAVGDIEQLEFFFAHMIGPMFTVIILPLVSIILAWHFNRIFALILIPVYLLTSVLIPLVALRAGRRIGERSRKSQGALKSTILESVYGLRDIQIFSAGKRKMQEMEECNKEVNKASHGLKIHRSILTSVPDFFVYAVRIFLIGAGGWLAANGAADPVGTIVVSFAASASFSSTFSLTTVVTNLLETFASAARIFTIEDTLPQVKEPENAVDIGKIKTIEFHDVSFAYPGRKERILNHASFTIHAGEKIGFIGDSGAGKSTVLRLLLHFYDPDEGQILINGVDLRNISSTCLHTHLSLLEQDTYLFDDTIKNNIAIGRINASDEQIYKAAKRAGIDAFIQTLPDGYDTPMGAMNARVSGGERQRIGLARILLRNTDMMIFDEPTSALDVLHEKEFLHTLQEESRNNTILMISHRMSTLTGCERILCLEDGKIVEK